MDETTFRDLRNRWMHGIDWTVGKLGKKWEILGDVYPENFTTKTAAYAKATEMVLFEARMRGAH